MRVMEWKKNPYQVSTRYCSLQIRAINTTQKQKLNQSPNKQKPPPPSPTAPPYPNPTTPNIKLQNDNSHNGRPPPLPQLQLHSANPRNPLLERPNHHGRAVFVDENAYRVPTTPQY
ncbi:hypothetical protein RHSIM_Rhsim09G0083900 [Rhododendron simsii]|uniref:Uncharacterized protein n=1 Tax=Rhododendron simsii TaxID=118357 RepID=A0A834GH52_RHOSS|nr:hypothetical protein RHSIM_Rhsim09G0083900 [Rhododendron simsii]